MRFFRSEDEYEHMAPFYDAIVDPFLNPVRREICRIARAERFESILDLCCGTGRQAIMLARSGFSVTGVDLSPAMLEVARKKSTKGLNFYLEDAANLHFKSNFFDCVMISFALHEKEPHIRNEIMKEARRVLAGDGRMIIVDYLAPFSRKSSLGLKLIAMAEWLAGRRHYANFKSYVESGATDRLLLYHNLEPVRAQRYLLDSTALIEAKWL